MIPDFVHMTGIEVCESDIREEIPFAFRGGQIILVDFEGVRLPMKVLSVYPDGTFDGIVEWEEA